MSSGPTCAAPDWFGLGLRRRCVPGRAVPAWEAAADGWRERRAVVVQVLGQALVRYFAEAQEQLVAHQAVVPLLAHHLPERRRGARPWRRHRRRTSAWPAQFHHFASVHVHLSTKMAPNEKKN